MILPSDVTKQFLYDKYRSLSLSEGLVTVGRSKFYAIWQENLPHISITKPSSDLCFTCQKNTMALQKAAHLSDDEKAELLEIAQEHLRRAKTERDYYNSQVDVAVASNEASPARIGHYSYDFAQQLHYPFNAQQTGPEYFKTARKCGLFSVCNDGKRHQVNYLIEEAQNPGKGADCIFSLVDHYLENHSQHEQVIYLHADNCTSQNKNNAMM